jgi:hypothetical protein
LSDWTLPEISDAIANGAAGASVGGTRLRSSSTTAVRGLSRMASWPVVHVQLSNERICVLIRLAVVGAIRWAHSLSSDQGETKDINSGYCQGARPRSVAPKRLSWVTSRRPNQRWFYKRSGGWRVLSERGCDVLRQCVQKSQPDRLLVDCTCATRRQKYSHTRRPMPGEAAVVRVQLDNGGASSRIASLRRRRCRLARRRPVAV